MMPSPTLNAEGQACRSMGDLWTVFGLIGIQPTTFKSQGDAIPLSDRAKPGRDFKYDD